MGLVGRLDQYASMLAGEFDDYSMSENFVSYSTYNASFWINNFPAGATLTTGIAAPDGTNTAIRFTCNNTTNALLRVNIPSFTPNGTDTYTTSFYVRLISGTGNAFTDLSDGNPSADYSSQLVTNQWVRVTVSGVPTATAKTFLDLFSDSNTNYVLDFWGVQLERGSVATDYTPTTTTAISRVLPSTTNTNITGLGIYYSSGFDENVGFTTFLSANILPPYDPVYDEFGGTLFGAGQGRYMRQNTDKSVIVYNEIDEITADFRDIVRTGLVLDLDAGMNASFNTTGTTWSDLSGRGNNGTLINSPSYSSNNGGYLSFDGSSNYGVITNFIPTISDMTVDMWLYVPSISSNMSFISSTDPTTSAPEYFQFGVDSSKYLTANYTFNQTSSNGLDLDLIGKENSWVNVVVTIQNGNSNPGTIKYYVNNISSIATTYGGIFFSGASPTMATRWTIAGFSNPFNTPVFQNGYNGRISTIKIYNRVLTETEISQNYNALKHRFGL